MAISFVGSASAAAASVTLPAHQAGDLIVIFANRTSATPPSLPAGYTSILTAVQGTTQSIRVGYKIAASGSETSGTWTNASKVVAVVYRGVNQASPIGGTDGYNNGNARAVESGPITFTDTGGTSWVCHGVGVNTNITFSSTVPTGMTYRDQQTASPSLGVYDTNGGVSSRTAVATDYSSGQTCAAVTFEIRADLGISGTASITEAADTVAAASVNQGNLINDGGANAAVWSYSGQTSVTGGQADPFGGTSACLFLETAANDFHQLVLNQNRKKAAAVKTYKFSAIVSGVGRDAAGLGFYDLTGSYASGIQIAFDLAVGAVGANASYGSTLTLIASNISPVASGWWLVEIIVEVSSAVLEFAPMVVPLLSSASYSSQYVGDTAKGFSATRETLIDLEWVKQGRAAITEAADTISAAGSLSALTISGTASITEAADTISAASVLAIAGVVSATEAGDTISAAGVVSIRAAAAITEDADQAAGAGALLNRGAAAITEGADTIVAAGRLAVAGAVAITEGADTVSAAATSSITGQAAIAESADTIAATGRALISGALSVALDADSIVSASRLAIAATAAMAAADDVLVSTGELARIASADITQADDTIAAVGRLAISGSASMTDTDDVAATGGAIAVGFADLVEADDTLVAAIEAGLIAEVDAAEEGDTLVAAGVLSLFGSASIVEAGDTLVAAGVVALVGQAAITEADDTISAAGMVAFFASASIIEDGDVISAAGVVSIRAAASITEAADQAEGAGALLNRGAAAIIEGDDVVTGVGRLAAKGAAVIAQGDDTVVAVGALAIAAVASIVEDGDTVAGAIYPGFAVYYWTGSAWILKPLKIWRGGQWVAVTRVSRWNGSAWVPMAA